jgi:hypothetical protein
MNLNVTSAISVELTEFSSGETIIRKGVVLERGILVGIEN